MANDIRVNEFNLNDPIRDLKDPLQNPIQDNIQKPPGFFGSLRNPVELVLEESLPASLYQWITGNTKKKQAQDAFRFLQNNQQLQGTGQYQEAERIYNKFGYLLEEGDQKFDFSEVTKLAKKHPGILGAELVNMVIADPYLLLVPSTFFAKLGRGMTNAIRSKYSTKVGYKTKAFKDQYIKDIKYGAAATLFTPLAFSTGLQLGEKGELDLGRTTTETTIGATAGLVLSSVFGGIGAMTARETGALPDKVNQAMLQAVNKRGIDKAFDINPKTGKYKVVEDTFNFLKDDIPADEFERLSTMISSAMREPIENGLDMAKATAFKAASVGAIGATAQFLTEPKDKIEQAAYGFGAGVGIYLAGKGLFKLFQNPEAAFVTKSINTVENALDAHNILQNKLNSNIVPIVTKIKEFIPDDTSRVKIFHYIQGTKLANGRLVYNKYGKALTKADMTKNELVAARYIRKVLDQYYKVLNKTDPNIIRGYRQNYLPLLWDDFNGNNPIQYVDDLLSNDKVYGPSPGFRFGKQRVFSDVNEGLAAGKVLRKGMDDPAELIRLYGFSVAKSVSTRELVKYLKTSRISPISIGYKDKQYKIPLLISDPRIQAGTAKFLKGTGKEFSEYYTPFKHPYLGGDIFVARGTEKSLRMIFDATSEGALTSGIFTLNLMMKRLAVGFSFFHAGALIESMFFAGSKFRTIKQFTKEAFSKKSTEITKMIDNPGVYMKEFAHANQAIKDAGFNDVIRFAQANRLVISTPEDAGFDRFYAQMRKFDRLLKHQFGIKTGEKIENVFRWFDRITWDRIFTHAKVYTFLTQFNKMIDPAVDVTQAQIYRKARLAAQFTNDAYGGQDWFNLTRRIQTPIFKSLAQTTFQPGSRGYMQLLMFAPDWTISNLRIIGKSLPAFENSTDARRLYGYYFARAAVMYAVAGSILNYIFSGKSLLENKDPTRIDMGDGNVLTFSKQLMEPFHWITDPQKTALKKIGSLPRTVTEVLTNKQYLTTGYSPSITKTDDTAIEKAIKIGGQAGQRFLPIWLQSSVRTVQEQLERGEVPTDIAADVALDFVLGQSGHPRYKGPRHTQYKLGGLVRNPYETLF
jgi:hypothetical protein